MQSIVKIVIRFVSSGMFGFTAGLILTLAANSIFASDQVPAKIQKNTIVLKGGTLHTIADGIIKDGVIVFENGKITAVGDLSTPVPANAEIIDVTGKQVYPGLIAPVTSIGLVEIDALRQTVDFNEVGDINPATRAASAYNPDSEIIPTVRSNGITTTQITPSGDILSGISSVVNLDGWTIEDAAVKDTSGIHVYWPDMKLPFFANKEEFKKKEKSNDENLKKLETAFSEARQYFLARKNGTMQKRDLRWEAMLPLFEKLIPLFVHAQELKQIETAVAFTKKFAISMVLVGGYDAWRVSGLLSSENIPVILMVTHALPQRADEDYDLPFRLPALLKEKGIKFAISSYGTNSWDTRNLPFFAGTSVSFGLDKETALRALTLTTAEILGIDHRLGSLSVGKDATLIVSTGDILDMQSSIVEMEFISGRKVDLNDRHKMLYEKYRQKYLPDAR